MQKDPVHFTETDMLHYLVENGMPLNEVAEQLKTESSRITRIYNQQPAQVEQNLSSGIMHLFSLKWREEQDSKTVITVGYLRVSRQDQDLEKNKADILLFADKKGFGKVRWVEEKVSGKISWKERAIAGVLEKLKFNDHLIVPEITRLGRSMLEIMEIMSICMQKGIHLYSLKEGWALEDSIQSKIFAMAFSMAAEIERDLISKRTTEALRARKLEGKILGRPKGSGKSKLDPFEPEIKALIANGSSKRFIARRYNTTPENLSKWLKKHSSPPPEQEKSNERQKSILG